MIFKIRILTLVLIVSSFEIVYSQNSFVQTISDVDSIPVLGFYSRIEKPDSIIYIKYDGERINVNCDIEFLGGWESLDAFCDSVYYNRKNYNHHELNAYVIYSILFDSNLHIQDIRIHKGIKDYYGDYDYNEMIKRILKQTERRWTLIKNKSKRWHLYIGSHRFM